MLGLLCLLAAPLNPEEVVVYADRVVRRGADRFFGINLNYIRDRDSNRPTARSLDDALREAGVRFLRYPGGEKSNFYLWSEPPYEKPHPSSLGSYAGPAGDRMDFDEYMTHVRKIGAEPYVVVGCTTHARSGRTKAQWLESAVAWVRYSNVVKKYGVRYWEIGNENWHNDAFKPTEMAEIVKEFSVAMKAVDPEIRIGASGDNDAWWSRFLPPAAPYLDFLTVSQYTGWEWGGYDRFLHGPELIETAKGALRAIDRYTAPFDRTRLHVIVAETNAKDYSEGGWKDSNDLGHALVAFAVLGRLASEPRVESAMMWNTRWMTDRDAPNSPFYALGPKNELTPTGRALALWGAFAQPSMVAVEGHDAFAARSDDGTRMTVWIMNPTTSARVVRLSIQGGNSLSRARRFRFWGRDDKDRKPQWKELAVSLLQGDACVEALPPVSVTVLALEGERK